MSPDCTPELCLSVRRNDLVLTEMTTDVAGYGLGPLLFAPLSEIAAIGRNWVYVPTFFLFVVLGIPTALVNNFAGLLVLRFLTGLFSSPTLANGGASIGDMVSHKYQASA